MIFRKYGGAGFFKFTAALVLSAGLGFVFSSSHDRSELGDYDDSRCGLFGEHEFSVSKAFLYFWVAYDGRDDWSVKKDPPPVGCEEKISSVTLELYWPEMSPAGHRPIQMDGDSKHISITIESVRKRDTWDLYPFFLHRSGLDLTEAGSGVYAQKFELFHSRGNGSEADEKKQEYYWAIDGSSVSLFFECRDSSVYGLGNCEGFQFYPRIDAMVTIQFSEEHLKDWPDIIKDSRFFIDASLRSRGN